MKKIFIAAFVLSIATAFITGCSVFEEMRISRHESNSSDVYLDAPLDKVEAAILKVVPKAGYGIEKEDSDTTNNIVDADFSGNNIEITCKKKGEKQTAVFIRVNDMGDKEEETKIIAALKKELKLK
jgi:hypothetical protein